MKILWSVIDITMRIFGILFILILFIIFNPKISMPIINKFKPTTLQFANVAGNCYKPYFRLEPGLIDKQKIRHLAVADSLMKSIRLKENDSAGLIWMGINPYNDSCFIIHDYYEDCSCGDKIFTLRRFIAEDDINYSPVIMRKMSWDQYFLGSTATHEKDDGQQ